MHFSATNINGNRENYITWNLVSCTLFLMGVQDTTIKIRAHILGELKKKRMKKAGNYNVKVQFTLHQAMKAQRGSRSIKLLFL